MGSKTSFQDARCATSPNVRASEGGGYESRGRFFVRVTVAPRKQASRLAPWATSLPDAIERGKVVQALVNRLRVAGEVDFVEKVVEIGATADAETLAGLGKKVDAITVGHFERVEVPSDAKGPLTFQRFAEQWTNGDLHRLYPDHVAEKRTADDDEMRMGKWVYPVVKDVALSAFTLEHAQEVLRRIPRDKSSGTRRHVAQLLVRVMNLAVYPCRHLKVSPLPRGFLPKLGPRKALAYLYPDEDAKLLACTEIDEETKAPKVPLVHRLVYGFLVREGMRSDEAMKLAWKDLDLERGTVRLDENKTDAPRTWRLDDGVLDALDLWHAMVPHQASDPVFPGLTKPYALAEMLRDHLHAAKIDRSELFETSKARRQIRVHDLRATFVTLALANGRTETWVMDRTGHTTSGQLNNYRRAARTAEELGIGSLLPLHLAIPEFAAAFSAANAAAGPRNRKRGGRLTPRHPTSSSAWIRTTISGIKIRCPAIRRRRSEGWNFYKTPAKTQAPPPPGRASQSRPRLAWNRT